MGWFDIPQRKPVPKLAENSCFFFFSPFLPPPLFLQELGTPAARLCGQACASIRGVLEGPCPLYHRPHGCCREHVCVCVRFCARRPRLLSVGLHAGAVVRGVGVCGLGHVEEGLVLGGVRGFSANVGAVSGGCALCVCVGGGRCASRLETVRCVCSPVCGCAGEVHVCPQPWVTRVWGVPVAESSLLPDLPVGHRCRPQTDGWRPSQPRPAPRPTVDCRRQPCRGPAEDGASPGCCRSRLLSVLDPPSLQARLPFASSPS